MAEQVAVDEGAVASCGLGRVDDADAFAVRGRADRPAEDVVRLAVDGAPLALQVLVRVAQRGVLGLRLGPWRSREHVGGWAVLRSRPEEAVFGARGPLVAARIVVTAGADAVTVTTLLRHERPVARWLWAGLAPVHRAVARFLLDRTARHLER